VPRDAWPELLERETATAPLADFVLCGHSGGRV